MLWEMDFQQRFGMEKTGSFISYGIKRVLRALISFILGLLRFWDSLRSDMRARSLDWRHMRNRQLSWLLISSPKLALRMENSSEWMLQIRPQKKMLFGQNALNILVKKWLLQHKIHWKQPCLQLYSIGFRKLSFMTSFWQVES